MKFVRRKSEQSLQKMVLRGFASAPPPQITDRLSPIESRLPEHVFRNDFRDSSAPTMRKPTARVADELPEIGAVIGRFRLESVLGVGAFAVVYRGTHLALSMPVALKFIRPNLATSRPELARQLHLEAELAARINHANVVRILDVLDLSDLPYVVMEFVDGESLAALVARERKLPVARVIQIGLDAARGLAAGAAAGVIHRDVKPANILLTQAGDAKVADFGLALEHKPELATDADARGMIGTPAYAAPEQIVGSSTLDTRADVYALGATLFHMLAGAPPYQAEEVRLLLRDKQRKDAPDVRSVASEVPAELAELVASMLRRDRNLRPPNMAAVIAALEAIARKLP